MNRKPEWALTIQEANRLHSLSLDLDHWAEAIRCPERDSGGVRCTADRKPEHKHRWNKEDMP